MRDGIAGRDEVDADVGLGAQRIEIVEIGDARQARHGDAVAAIAPGQIVEGKGIFGGQARRGAKVGDRADAGHATALGNEALTLGKEARITTEAIDQRGGDER